MIKLPVIVSLDEQSDQEIEQGRTWAVVDPDGNEICSGILLYDEAVEMARNTNRYPEALQLLEVARCPHPKCKDGSIDCGDHEMQCRWCDERSNLLAKEDV